MHACMHTRTHIHPSKIVTAMSHFTASGLDKKEQYSCLYSRANSKVWLYFNQFLLFPVIISSASLPVNTIVMSSNTSITSIFMLALLHQIELEA